MTFAELKLKWNQEHIIQHRLAEDVLAEAQIEKLDPTEIFVEHPKHEGYYVSQYGRVVSLKRKKVTLLGAFIGGQSDRQYLYYGFSDGGTKTIGAHRAVADVFCPNFWKKSDRLEAHHLDGNKLNNDYRNLILLTTPLHAAIHKIKKIVLLEGGKIQEYKNPLDLVYDTGLTLEEILLANKGKKKPLKSEGGYTVYDIKGYLIGFQYYPQKDKRKK
jgi:hypothetical protein